MNPDTEPDLSNYMRGQQLATDAINQDGGEEEYPSNPSLMAKQLEGKSTLSNMMMDELSKAAKAGNIEGRQEGFGVGQQEGHRDGMREGHEIGSLEGRQDGFKVGQMTGLAALAQR